MPIRNTKRISVSLYCFGFLLMHVSNLLHAGNPFILSAEIRSAWTEVNRLRINTARDLIQKDALANPGNPFHYLLLDQANFAEAIVTDDPLKYRLGLGERQIREMALSSADQSSPFYLFALAEFHLHWAILRMKFGDTVQGSLELRKARQMITRNQNRFPEFYLNLKTIAIIQAIAGAVPPNFQWLASKAGITGTTEEGLQNLKKLDQWLVKDQNYAYLQAEVIFYQLFIYRNLPGKFSDEVLTSRAENMAKSEPLLRFALATLAHKFNNPAEVIRIFQETNAVKPEVSFCYLNYLNGEAMLNQGIQGSEKQFHSFVACTKGEQYVKSAYRKWAWAALLQNEEPEYKRLMVLVLTKGSAKHEDDKQALLEAGRKSIPPVDLIRARIYFDGGKFRESVLLLLKLNQVKSLLPDDKAELHYRLGRAYEKLNEEALAMIFYKAAMLESAHLPDYIYAASAFNLAQINESSGKASQAIRLYSLVISSKDHPYKKSLDAKARVALNRLRR
jgi:hypothetical protein